MRIVYIAHPISGDVKGNLEKIRCILRSLNLSGLNIVPFAPYWVDCHVLNDDDPVERERGIRNDQEFFRRKSFDELWLYGDKISRGMFEEIKLAIEYEIPIYPMTSKTKEQFERLEGML